MDVVQAVNNEYEYMVERRRYYHEHPELSSKEIHTLESIEEELTKIGIPWVYIENGGILGTINGKEEGKTVLLRADIDALPIKENPKNMKTDKVCISKSEGAMHACGHDAHIAMLLAEAKILQNHREEWKGRVYVCFEQGEEGTSNIIQILRYIEQHKLHIDSCYATHVRWDIPVGKICVNDTTALAGLTSFLIDMEGRAGHGSRPDLGNSPLDCFTQMYHMWQMEKMKYLNPEQVVTFSVGIVNCGTVRNVIPDHLHCEGTIRYYNNESGAKFWEDFKRIIREMCDFYGIKQTINIETKYVPTVNHPKCRDLCKRGITNALGEDALFEGSTWMASESMSYFLAKFPGVNTFTGIRNEERGITANHHTPEFEIDEKGMITGAVAAISYVLEYMNCKEEITQSWDYDSFENLITYCHTV